jgi:Cohesin domain/PEP-CTERM motif
MRTTNLIKTLFLLAAATIAWSQPAGAVAIGFDPASPVTVSSGSTLNVDIVVSALGTDIVAAYDLDVTYDMALLAPVDVVFGSLLGDGIDSIQGSDLDTSMVGVVDLFEVSLLSDDDLFTLQGGGPVTVATLVFDVLADGEAAFGFIFDDFNDVKGRENRVIIPGREPSLPEPGSLVILVLGLAGLAAGRRRRG